jgi:hypothetical protein
MRILLDENFPADFAKLLVGHDTSNVHSHGWAGIKNGQNIKVLSFGVVVVRSRSNRIKDLSPHISGILHTAIGVRPDQVMTVGT